MNSKKILWQMIGVFILFCISKFDSTAGSGEDKSDSKKQIKIRRPNMRWGWACGETQFKCTHYGPCLDKKLICDGARDCPLGNDEEKNVCQNNKCPAEKFQCATGACIDRKYLCDGVKHCLFEADDEKSALCKNTTCPATKYQCRTGSCLDRSLLCNGFADCLDGDDESADTCENFVCPENKFQCSSGACIDQLLLCDGLVHCIFGTSDDESPELCKNRTGCPVDKYQCESGECIDASKVCNTYEDCSDEDEKTNNCAQFFKKQQQNNATCFLPSESALQTFTVDCPNTGNCSDKAEEQVPISTKITIHCNESCQFKDGNTSISGCFQGIWKPPIKNCYRTCAPIRDPDMDLKCFQKLRGVSIPCDNALIEGAIVYPRCKDYYRPDREPDYPYIRCQSNGEWDRELFKCIPECGRVSKSSKSLTVEGKPEQRGDSPWHVAIYDVSNRKELMLICGGTIIAPQLIVSAAHCFYDFTQEDLNSPFMYEAVVAKYTRDYNVKDYNETKVYKIRKIFIPDMMKFTGESTNFVGDIALLWTREKIAFNREVLPACIEWTYTTRFILPDNTEGKLVGWGVTETGQPSTVLLAAFLPYVSYRACIEIVSEEFKIGIDKFCAGTKTGVGARPGDSGGGLLFRKAINHENLYYLRGIVSNKDGSTGEKQTSIAAFTDIAQFTTWMYEKRTEIENEELLAENKLR